MTYRVDILWPGGNTTALVRGNIDRSQYADIATAIIQSDPTVEQVGFLEPPTSSNANIRLQMMGGEFCGNATRCAAYLYATGNSLSCCSCEVSGYDGIISAVIHKNQVALHLPGTLIHSLRSIPDGDVVDLKGIRHILLPYETSYEQQTHFVKAYRDSMPAIGICTYKKENDFFDLNPYVWVEVTKTLIHETGCGSGSIALAYLQFIKNEEQTLFHIRQPSGAMYEICLVLEESGISEIRFSGEVQYRGIMQ